MNNNVLGSTISNHITYLADHRDPTNKLKYNITKNKYLN